MARTWRNDLPPNRCRHCRELFWVSQEAINDARESRAGTDQDIADSIDTCLSCTHGEEVVGEKLDVDGDPDDLCPRCGGEKPATEPFCSDDCAAEYADQERFLARDSEGATYTLDGSPTTLEDFFAANPILFEDERTAILALRPGEEAVVGRGDAAAFILRREP